MATSVTHWTVADLAEYCEHCMVIAIKENEKYCNACVEEIVEYLARVQGERDMADKGLY